MADKVIGEDFLSADDILAVVDIEYATVKAWGKTARLQSLTAGEMIEFREANEGEAKRTAGLRLIINSLVDKAGNRILNNTHIAMLRLKSEKQNNAIIKEILKLNGLNVDEKATKND